MATGGRKPQPDATSAPEWLLRLYVAGQTAKSIAAFANLKQICETHLKGQYKIELVDLLVNPQLAKGDQIVAVPTLVRQLPPPVKKIIGDLAREERVLIGLDLKPHSAEAGEQMTALPENHLPENDDPAGQPTNVVDLGTEKTLREFEKLVADLAQPTYVFRLYIAGTSTRSSSAIANIRRICEQYLAGRYELEVVDAYQQPGATKQAQVIAMPTLVKELPLPAQRFVGDMSNSERIVVGLKLNH